MKKKFSYLLVCSISLLLLPGIVLADTLTVCSNNCNYATLPEAVNAATENDVIQLQENVVLTNTITINKEITIDLNEFSISKNQLVFLVENGKLTLIGEGTVKETTPYYGAILIKGSSTATDTNYSVVNVGEDVTLEGWAGVFIDANANKHAYGTVVNIDGTIKGVDDKNGDSGIAVYINGTIKDKTNYPTITINDSAVITSTGPGIYAAGYAKWNIGAASITGVESGLGIKAGIVNLNGTVVKATGDYEVPEGFSNGINASGAAIQIEANTDYAGDIELTIDGGSYTSEKGVVIYEYIGKGTKTSIKSIKIENGTFNSALGRAVITTSEEFLNEVGSFINGGIFTGNITQFVTAGHKAYVTADEKMAVEEIEVKEGTYDLTGTITNGAGAIIKLKLGASVLKEATADESGAYTFEDLADGTYNLLITVGEVSTMATVTIAGDDETLNLTMPRSGSIDVYYVGDKVEEVVVEGIESVSPGNAVELIIIETEADAENYIQESLKEEIGDKTVVFYDFELLVNSDALHETDNLLHMIMPFDFTSKEGIVLYRYHGQEVEKLTEITDLEDAEDGTFYIDKTDGKIHIFASKFSTYAVGYTTIVPPKTFDAGIMYILIGIISVLGICGLITYKKRYN